MEKLGNITLYNADNMDIMKQYPDKYFELAIIDPPYGKKQHGGINRGKFVTQTNGNKMYVADGCYKKKKWDNKPPTKKYFNELIRVSKNQIIWGENYMPIKFGSGRIVWDKINEGSDQSDCEIAYNSLTKKVDLFKYMWRGMLQGKNIFEGHIQKGNKKQNEKRIHPTQKPVALYKWILNKYAKQGDKILDTHFGSLSIGIACHDLGYELTAIELDVDYYEQGKNRLKEHQKQLSLFIP